MNINDAALKAIADAMKAGDESITDGKWMPSVVLENSESQPVLAIVAVPQSGEVSTKNVVATFERSADLRRVMAALRATEGAPTVPLENMGMMDTIKALHLAIRSAEDAAQSDETWAEFRQTVLSAQAKHKDAANQPLH